MKAIALLSGGLDSTLATKLIKEQGIQVLVLNMKTPFCLCDRKAADGCGSYSRKFAENLGIEFRGINVTREFFSILKEPKYGYGSHMNPCIDCRILLFKKAKEMMQEAGASFVITGEVLGQRPMSQKRNTMKLIEKEAGLEGLVLRPLSAKILEPSIPERQGWVARDKLLAISGRGRTEQIALAREFALKDYPCPSGGCLLTDPEFSKRIEDLMKHTELNLQDIQLLKIGRHFRLTDTAKLVVGRNEQENGQLFNLAQETDYLFMPTDESAGPTSLGRGVFNDELLKLSCSITCRYCDLNGNANIDIVYKRISEKENKVLKILPIEEAKLSTLRI